MKPYISYSLILAAAACGMASAAETAYTTPVGYTTTVISQAYGPTAPKNNVIAPLLQNSSSWAGNVSGVVGDVVSLTSAALTPGAYNPNGDVSFLVYAYYIQTSDGYWAQIASNDATSVTVEAGAGANFSVAENVIIRRHVTINDYFGANNSANLLASSAGDAEVADNINIIDEVNGGAIIVIASDALGGTWITDAFEEAGGIAIYPDQGLQVLRRGATNLGVVQSGEVDVLPRQIGINAGVQIRPYDVPTATTLTTLGLYTGNPATGVVPSETGDTAEADIVTVLSGGVPTNYFYSTIDLGGGVGWYDDGLSFVGDIDLPAGVGLIINRSNPTNSSPFVWVKPATAVSP